MQNIENKKLGILGGMGPLATAKFYEHFVNSRIAEKDQDHVDTIIASIASFPDRTSTILSCRLDAKDKFLEKAKYWIEYLDAAGVDIIAIPCNTSHFYYDKLIQFTNTPIFHMPREVLKKIESSYPGFSVAILGTQGTIKSQVYTKEIIKLNLTETKFQEEFYKKIMDIIYSIKKGDRTLDGDFVKIVEWLLDNNCIPVIACTELSLVDLSSIDLRERKLKYFDAMKYMAEKINCILS